MWLLFAVICIGLGLVLFSGLQAQLPDELSFLKSSAPAEIVTPTQSAPMPALSNAQNWNVSASGEDIEISRDFDTKIRGYNGVVYDQPTFFLTCYHHALYARIDTRMRTKGGKNVPVSWQGSEQTWLHGEGQNIFAPDVPQLVASAQAGLTAKVTLEFEEAPRQTLTLRLSGLQRALTVMGKSCQIPSAS